MDTMSAVARGMASRGREQMVFDWVRAATEIAKHRPREASAGLSDDWDWTGGRIWADGKPVPREDTYTFLASTWATPELDIDGDVIDCYRMQSDTPGWGSDTYWPPEALAIVGGSVTEGEVIKGEVVAERKALPGAADR